MIPPSSEIIIESSFAGVQSDTGAANHWSRP